MIEHNKLLMEFLGTMILSLAINMSTAYSLGNQFGDWLLIFAGFFTAVTWTREVSGGHLNPAVSTAVYFSKSSGRDINNLIGYILSQILGATAACLISYLLYNGNIFQLKISPNASQIQALTVEILATFFFTYTILCQGNNSSKLTVEKSASTLIIALALFASASVGGQVSGGCINPAIGIGHNFTRFFIFQSFSEIQFTWLYIIGPITGGIIASLTYNSFYDHYFSEQDNKAVSPNTRI
jgi:glycerol uptake facilitator-like aquaporin